MDKILNQIIKNKNGLKVIIVIVFNAAVAFFGAIFTDTSSQWYCSLTIPRIQPPPIVFMSVWIFLYLLLAFITIIAVLDDGFSPKLRSLLVTNGILNILWSYTFFNMQNSAGSFVILIVLIIVGYFIFVKLNAIKPILSYLFTIYLVWLLFALLLNYAIIFLN